jgi:CAAX prenyl protease-like protein
MAGQIVRRPSIFEDMPGRARRVPLPPAVVTYWEASRSPRYSIVLALPLLVTYEALAAFLSTGQGAELRNGADVLLRELILTVAGRHYAPLVFGLTVIGLSVWYIGRDLRATRTPLSPRIFAGMLVESALLALCFGSIVGALTSRVVGAVGPSSLADASAADWPATLTAMLSGHLGSHLASAISAAPIPAGGTLADAPTTTKVMLALGAGVYEELLFRVILVSGIAFIARRVLGWRPHVAAAVAVVLSAFVFAAFHYIGPYGDPLRLDSFVFRLIGGVVFSALYVMRGFGITAWTHALYDLMVLVA